jgi:hypothetical protein
VHHRSYLDNSKSTNADTPQSSSAIKPVPPLKVQTNLPRHFADSTSSPFNFLSTFDDNDTSSNAVEVKSSENRLVIELMDSSSPYINKLQIQSIIVNTASCRGEGETLSMVCKKHEYKETKEPNRGNIQWFGMGIKDSDVELYQQKPCFINRYPLMDVSLPRFT